MSPSSESRSSKTTSINLRIQSTTLDLIDHAARSVGKSRSDFVIDAVRREAEAVLLDRSLFLLDGHAFRVFTAALDKPPVKNAKLNKLLAFSSPWER